MYEEAWVIAKLKRWLAQSIEADKAEKGYIPHIDKELVLAKIAQLEADAVLGEPEPEQGLPWTDNDGEEDDK